MNCCAIMPRIVVGIAVSLLVAGCVIKSPVVPPVGPLYNNTGFPVDITFHSNDIGSTSGAGAAGSILGLIAWGDATPATAARNANIQQIDQIDAQYFCVLFGIYQQYKTIVHGKTAEQLSAPSPSAPK